MEKLTDTPLAPFHCYQILVVTGGESWMAESVQPDFLTCDALDVISIHAYGTGDFSTSSIKNYVQQAQSAGKKLIFEEWCVCNVHLIPFIYAYHRMPLKLQGCMLL